MLQPSQVNILGTVYSITYCDKPSDVAHNGRTSLWGEIDYWDYSIRVYDNGRSPEALFHTILHEVIHGICSTLHLDNLHNGDNHDKMDSLALALTDVFFRNKWIEWI
jgi:hypothetical protein